MSIAVTTNDISFRKAAASDSAILLAWRNDPETIAASLVQDSVAPDDHENWLRASLASDRRELMIVQYKGRDIGTIRLDQIDDGERWELSWTVAPSARGKGLGKAMVAAAALLASRPLIAQIRQDNPGSQKIAQAAGFQLESKEGDIEQWVRD